MIKLDCNRKFTVVDRNKAEFWVVNTRQPTNIQKMHACMYFISPHGMCGIFKSLNKQRYIG